MSVVGPRPCLPGEYARYSKAQRRRVEAVPGITGLWQVEARLDPSAEAYFRLDTHYIANWSFWLDIKILMKTVKVVLSGTGR
jgi:lipopolysaccharide/colanic/teichoic acid biosynthesis glycosyltransferase